MSSSLNDNFELFAAIFFLKLCTTLLFWLKFILSEIELSWAVSSFSFLISNFASSRSSSFLHICSARFVFWLLLCWLSLSWSSSWIFMIESLDLNSVELFFSDSSLSCSWESISELLKVHFKSNFRLMLACLLHLQIIFERVSNSWASSWDKNSSYKQVWHSDMNHLNISKFLLFLLCDILIWHVNQIKSVFLMFKFDI